jgi:hypothetical protein
MQHQTRLYPKARPVSPPAGWHRPRLEASSVPNCSSFVAPSPLVSSPPPTDRRPGVRKQKRPIRPFEDDHLPLQSCAGLTPEAPFAG